MGHSAGAHAAGLIATDAGLRRRAGSPRGFVGIEGTYDVPALAARFPDYGERFLGEAFSADRRGWAGASPTWRAVASRGMARGPWLLAHSDADELVDAAQTDGFEQRLRGAGVRVERVRLRGASHFAVPHLLESAGSPLAEAVARLARGR